MPQFDPEKLAQFKGSISEFDPNKLEAQRKIQAHSQTYFPPRVNQPETSLPVAPEDLLPLVSAEERAKFEVERSGLEFRTQQKLARELRDDGLVKQALKNTLYKGADLLTFGASKRVLDKPVLTQLLDEHVMETPFLEDNSTMQVSRVMMGMGEASGAALSFVAPTKLFALTTLPRIAKSAAVFSTVGGVRRVMDPDIAPGMTWDKWVVGTGLDAMLGAAFPFLGKLGGSVLEQPNQVKALGQFLLQTGAISTSMDAIGFTESFYGALRENPDKRALEVFNDVATQFISNPEQLVKNFATMGFLHATGTGTRFMKGGKATAQNYQDIIKQTGLLVKDLPEWAGKAPKTIEEAQRFNKMWMDASYRNMLNLESSAEFLKRKRLRREAIKAKQIKIPETEGKPYATEEDIVRMSLREQIEALERMGYHPDHVVRMSGEQRTKLVADQIKPTEAQRKPIDGKAIPGEKIPPKPEKPAKEPLEVEKPLRKPSVEIKPEPKPPIKPETTAESIPIVTLKVSDVKMDPERFQPREKVQQAMVDKIATEFDPAEWVEPTLWEDPATGELIVVSGHTRQMGVKKGGYESATYKILPKGTTEEQARRYAETGNLARIEQTDFENAGIVRRRADQGDTITQIQSDLPALGSTAKVRSLLNLSYLDAGGLFREVYDKPTDFPKIVSLSAFTGYMRRKYPWMGSSHEKDLFSFFYTEGNVARGDVREAKLMIMDGLEKMDKLPGDKPARLEWLMRGGLTTGFEATHPEVAGELKDRKRARDRIRLTLNEEEGLTNEIVKQLRQEMRRLEIEIAELQGGLEEGVRQQETMFSEVPRQRTILGKEESAQRPLTSAETEKKLKDIEKRAQLRRDREYIEQRAKEGKITQTAADIMRQQVASEKKALERRLGQEDLFGESNEQKELFSKAKGHGSDVVREETLEQARIRSNNVFFREAKPSQEAKTKKTISKREIISFVQKVFKVPIRGKTTERKLRAGVKGFFKPGPKIIRTQISEDIYTMTHEIAHFIDQEVWGRTTNPHRPHFTRWELELGNLDYDSNLRRTSEGFAEFMRYYLSTETAKEQAPNFYRYFRGEFAREQPELFKKIEQLREMMTVYNNQGSEARVKSQIDFTGKISKGLGERVKDAWELFRQAFITDIAFLEEVFYKKARLKGKLTPSEDPIEIAIGVKGKAPSKAQEWVMFNTTDWVGRITGKSLADILKPVSKNKKTLRNFLAYAYSRRALTRPDINAGIELSDAELVFNKYDSKAWRKASDDLSDFSDRGMQYMVDSGALSPEARNKIKGMNPFYLPLKRFFIDNITVKGRGGGKRIVDVGTPIKRIKGSGRAIINPLESMTVYIENMIAVADKTRLARAIANLAEREGIGGLINEIPAPIKAKNYSMEQVTNAMKKAGIDPKLDVFGDEMLTLFSQGKKYTGADNVVTIWINGKPKFYEVHPKLLRVLKGVDYYTLPPLIDFFLGKPTRMVKLGAVGLNAAFSYIRNPARDIPTYMIYSESKIPNPAAPMLGIAADLGIGSKKALEAARRYRAMGGDMATIMGRDRAKTRKLLQEAIQKSRGMKGKTIYMSRHPVDALRRAFQVTEMGPRVAEMQGRVDYWEKVYGKDSDSAYLKTFNESQDVTVNFSRMGYISAALNKMIPFYNPAIQGGSKMVRMAKERPMALILKGAATITVPVFYTWFMNKDEEWYQNIPAPVKYSHLYIDLEKLGGPNEVVVMPLPHELGTLFGGLPMAHWDEMNDIDPEAMEEAGKLFLQQVWPGNPLTDLALIKPLMDAKANETWYGAPLESFGMQFKEVPDRYYDHTLELAKILSRGLHELWPNKTLFSPPRIEAMMQGYTGGLSNTIAKAIELTTGQTKVGEASDIPIAGSLFLRKKLYEQRANIDWDRLRSLRLKRGSKTITRIEERELMQLERKVNRAKRQKQRRKRRKATIQ